MKGAEFTMNKHQLPIDRIISRLGYNDSENFIRCKDIDNKSYSSHTVKILEEIKPYAAYFIDNTPFILFFDSTLNDEITFKKVSKQIWNAQIPIAFFCNERTVKIYNGMSLDISSYLIKQVTEYEIDKCDEHADFSYWEISNPIFWKKHSSVYSATKLNQHLLDNITFLTNKLKNTYHINFATKLVLRLIFIRYLIDRGVDLAYGNFTNDIEQSQNQLLIVIRSKKSLYDLFSYLKSKFNGNLFDLDDEINSNKLTDDVFILLADFFSGKVSLEIGQLSLFAMYDFNIIPVELISNIYEILLGKEIRDKDNAFYTPNYLVEYILDKTVLPTLKSNLRYTILDPACGSGVFLVDSYRRIVEENLREKVYCDDDDLLKNLLTENIYGIDVNDEAIDVTIFSLYLTILDYKDPKTLSKFTLPNLKGVNLFVSDFFDDIRLSDLKKIEFDFIIGNPPWGNVKDGLHMEYCNKNGYRDKQQNNEISRSFVFRAKDFSNSNTHCCFILHSKLLYNKKKPALNFRHFLLKETKICNIIELSSVRKLVFENADAPAAIVIFQYNNQDNLNNKFLFTSVKRNVFFKLFNIIVIEKNDIKVVPQKMLYQYDWAWKTIVYGFSHDIDNIISLKHEFKTIKQTLREAEPPLVLGAGIQDHVGDAQDASGLVGLTLLDSDKGVNHFYISVDNEVKFNKPYIHRTRKRDLFVPPYCITAKGIDCSTYKMRSAYSEESFICKETMYVVKGQESQKDILLNLTGLINSSLYAYLNLMIGSSLGIEREQRFMNEVLSFPYVFSREIADKTKDIQDKTKQIELFCQPDTDIEIDLLDKLILKEFGLQNDKFVDYTINVQIPELANLSEKDIYRKVSEEELKIYSACFEQQFSLIYKQVNKYISIVLYPEIKGRFSVFELRILEDDVQPKINISKDVDTNKELLTRFSVFNHNDMFHQIKDVIHFSKDSFFIIKPNFYKNWHPAIAELDLVDVMDQIMSSSGGEES